MKNERRKRRKRYRQHADWTGVRRDWPLVFALSAPLDLEFGVSLKKCQGCGSRGWRERRDKPHGRVPCRVCQGAGVIHGDFSVYSSDGKIRPFRPSKVYWQARRWWRLYDRT
jgi:hypothetical protein